MIVEFTGWIPTITGNLSFSTIGLGRTPRRDFSFFRKTESVQWTVVVQKRNKSDSLFPFIVDRIFGLRGEHYFALIGKSIAGDIASDGLLKLSGHVFIYSAQLHELVSPMLVELRKEVDRSYNDTLRRNGANQDDSSFDPDFGIRIENWIDRYTDRLMKEIGTSDCFLCGFQLARNGLIEIRVDQSLYPDADELETIALQSYFFIKDIAHAHQHHSRNSDTILEVYRDCASGTLWRRETLYALYKWIIQRKRERSEVSYVRASGVLAYIKAFKELHLQDVEKQSEVPMYLIDEVAASLEAGRKEAELLRADRNNSFSYRTWFLAFIFSIAIATFSLIFSLRDTDPSEESQQQVSKQQGYMLTLIELLTLYPFAAITVVLSVAFIAAQFSKPKSSVLSRPFVLTLLRIGYSMPFFVSLTLTFLATVGTILLTVIVIWWGFT